jgi:hypothetical protein
LLKVSAGLAKKLEVVEVVSPEFAEARVVPVNKLDGGKRLLPV